MEFSDDDVKAYVKGNIQRTKTVKFTADKLQTITMKLPKNVILVNVTTGNTSKAGVDVEISGGTQFYLTAKESIIEMMDAIPTDIRINRRGNGLVFTLRHFWNSGKRKRSCRETWKTVF